MHKFKFPQTSPTYFKRSGSRKGLSRRRFLGLLGLAGVGTALEFGIPRQTAAQATVQPSRRLSKLELLPLTETEQAAIRALYGETSEMSPVFPVTTGMVYLPLNADITAANAFQPPSAFSERSPLSSAFEQHFQPFLRGLAPGGSDAMPRLQLGLDICVEEQVPLSASLRGIFLEEFTSSDAEGNAVFFQTGTAIYLDQAAELRVVNLYSTQGEFVAVRIGDTPESQAYADWIASIPLERPPVGDAFIVEYLPQGRFTLQLFTEDDSVPLIAFNDAGTNIRKLPGTNQERVGELRGNLLISPLNRADRDEVYQAVILLGYTEDNPIPTDAYGYALELEGYTWSAVEYFMGDGQEQQRGIGWTARNASSNVEIATGVPIPVAQGAMNDQVLSSTFNPDLQQEVVLLDTLEHNGVTIQFEHSNLDDYARYFYLTDEYKSNIRAFMDEYFRVNMRFFEGKVIHIVILDEYNPNHVQLLTTWNGNVETSGFKGYVNNNDLYVNAFMRTDFTEYGFPYDPFAAAWNITGAINSALIIVSTRSFTSHPSSLLVTSQARDKTNILTGFNNLPPWNPGAFVGISFLGNE